MKKNRNILFSFPRLTALCDKSLSVTCDKGYVFFLKKYSYSQCCWKKYSDFGGGKKNKYDSEFLSYNLMLNSGKKNSDSARQKK